MISAVRFAALLVAGAMVSPMIVAAQKYPEKPDAYFPLRLACCGTILSGTCLIGVYWHCGAVGGNSTTSVY